MQSHFSSRANEDEPSTKASPYHRWLQYKVVKVAVTEVFKNKSNQMIKTAIPINSNTLPNAFTCWSIVKFAFKY